MRLVRSDAAGDYLGFCLLGSWVFSTDMDCKFFIALALVDLLHFM